MTAGFDPAAATAAWLARVPAAAQAAAERHAQGETLAWGLGLVGPAVIAWALVRSGVADRVWRWGAQRGPRTAELVVVGLVAIVSCVWGGIERAVAGSGWPPIGVFCAGVFAQGLVFAGALLLLNLAGRRPRLVFGAVVAGLSFGLVFGPTLFDELYPPSLQPAPARVAEAAREVARASGVAAGDVYVTPYAPGEGDVVGLIRSPHILLTPAGASASLSEVRAGLGHVLGHYRARDGLGWALVLAALGVGGVVFVISGLERLGRLSPLTQGLYAFGQEADGLEEKAGIRMYDARSLPILWALAAAWIALAHPAAFAWDRAANLRADRFSLEYTREPDGLVAGLIRENGLQPVDPPWFERWIVMSHPPLKDRISQAMRWKADHIR
jgi:STE24 endopeptidase